MLGNYRVSGRILDDNGRDYDGPVDKRGVRVDITSTTTPGVADSDQPIPQFQPAFLEASNTNETLRAQLGGVDPLPVEAKFDFEIMLDTHQFLFFRVNDLGSNRFDGTRVEIQIQPTIPEPNQIYQYQVEAIDPDDDQLTYRLTQNPERMTIEEDSGLILWQPTSEQLGDHNVAIRVEDGHGGFDEQSFILEVITQINGTISGATFVDRNGDGNRDQDDPDPEPGAQD